MIERMKKVSLLCIGSRRRTVVSRLGTLGLLHIDEGQLVENAVPDLQRRLQICQRALTALNETEKNRPIRKRDTPHDTGIHQEGEECAKQTVAHLESIERVEEERRRLLQTRERIAPWGAFLPEEVEQLAKRDIELRFCTLPKRQFAHLQSKAARRLFRVGQAFGTVYCVLVALPGEERPQIAGLQELATFEQGLPEIDTRLHSITSSIKEHTDAIARLLPCKPLLDHTFARLDQLNRLSQLQRSMKWDSGITHLTGFIPTRGIGALREAATRHGWGLLIRDPDPDDPTPTKVRRHPIVSIVDPIFSLLGTTPGYREQDIGVWFLLFFGIFFGMIIGDAGYGALLTIYSLTMLLIALARRSSVSLTTLLFLVLGICAMAWGAITGNWFGHEPIAGSTPLGGLTVPELNSFDARSIPFVQWISFALGTVHIGIAHIWRFLIEVRERPRIRSLAQLGWLSLIWGLYSLVISLVLSEEPFFRIRNFSWFIVGGIAAIALFGNQEGRFLQGVLTGLKSLFITLLNGISAFGDIISYVRLFAVGIASVEIARSFNIIAGSLGDGVLAIIASIVILCFGHSLNMAMGALSVVVHGVRLKMLEFSTHLGMEWSGIPYRPFRKQIFTKHERSA